MRYERMKLISIKFNRKPIVIPEFECKKIKLKKFPVEGGTYLIGNEFSPVAVVIPRPNKALLKIAIESGASIAGHLVTANIGIEKLIANIIANPNIRFIILFGKESEGHLSADSLLALHKNGIDENGKIIGSHGLTPYIRNLPPKAVNRFRKQILEVINLLGEEEPSILKRIVNACIQEPENAIEIRINSKRYHLYDPGALNAEPIIIQLTEKLKNRGLYETLSPYSTVIHAPTISSAYPLLIEAILSSGKEVIDERGSTTKELLNVQVNIMFPEKNPIPFGYRPEGWIKTDKELKTYLEKYSQTYFKENLIVSYEDNKITLRPCNVTYTYGSRLTNFEGTDQIGILIKAIKNAIKKNQASRRFVISLANPKIDLAEETEKVEIPCFTQFWVYNRKENNKWTLHGTMFLRSHDAHLAFPANTYAGMKILKYLCNKTNTKIGTLTMFFGSAHIYMER
jgi:tetrahydromethanopterin S-methyltransferase subunit A